MTHFRTCVGCAVDRKACQRLAEVRTSLRGLNITSVKFKCDDRRDLFQPGQRVVALVRYGLDGEQFGDNFPGTVISQRGARATVAIDAEGRDVMTNERGFGRFSLENVKPIDEPPQPICSTCCGAGPDFVGCEPNSLYPCARAAS